MKKGSKYKSGIYTFLNASGLLEQGTNEDIERAKKQYWKEYKKRWKKEKQKESKSFEIVFTLSEARDITKQAERKHTTPTNYIRQCVLTNKRGVIDLVVMGDIRELLVLHHSFLQILNEENIVPTKLGEELLEQISQIEKRTFDFFLSLKEYQ